MSVERVMEYSKLDAEKQPEEPVHLINDWPSKGKIEFKKVSYRHFVDAQPVLRELTFSVHQNEKIGMLPQKPLNFCKMKKNHNRILLQELLGVRGLASHR